MHRLCSIGVAVSLMLALQGPAIADSDIENITKYRHAVMDLLAGHMSALALIAQGKVDRGAFTESHATAIASATSEIGALFPEGSGGGDTHALPAIWENPDEFAKAVSEAREAGAALGEAAGSGDPNALMPAFAAVGKTCKGCHEDYREEHDH